MIIDLIIHHIGETPGQQSIMAEYDCVQAGVEFKGSISAKSASKILAQASLLAGIEPATTVQIGKCSRQYLDHHSARFRSSCFAAAQSIGCSSPALGRAAVSCDALPCQSGDSKRDSSSVSDSHNSSMARSFFSSRDICLMASELMFRAYPPVRILAMRWARHGPPVVAHTVLIGAACRRAWAP
jgi:hypothetical protein